MRCRPCSGIQDEVGFASLRYDDQIGKLSLVGAGMKSNPGVSATFFKALAAADINVEMISTSEIRISIITRDDRLDDARARGSYGLRSRRGRGGRRLRRHRPLTTPSPYSCTVVISCSF
jgi:hypothetical protein